MMGDANTGTGTCFMGDANMGTGTCFMGGCLFWVKQYLSPCSLSLCS